MADPHSRSSELLQVGLNSINQILAPFPRGDRVRESNVIFDDLNH